MVYMQAELYNWKVGTLSTLRGLPHMRSALGGRWEIHGGSTMKNQIKTVMLLGSLSALVVGFGALVAPGHLYLFGALALVMNLGAYFFSDRLVLRMQGAREVSPEDAPDIYAIVRELATT